VTSLKKVIAIARILKDWDGTPEQAAEKLIAAVKIIDDKPIETAKGIE
jgi:hypothetical protein